MSHPPLVVLFDPESLSPAEHESALASGGYRTERAASVDEALAALGRDDPAALVVVEGRTGPAVESRVCHAARDRGIPVLGLIDHEGDGASLKDRVKGYDGWTHYAVPSTFIVARLGELLNGDVPDCPSCAEPIPIDGRLLAMIVHDVRNPLNVIGLTLRVIEQLPASQRTEVQEDLNFLRDNAGQIEKILGVLSDVCRLVDLGPPSPIAFEPRRFVEDLLEERSHKVNGKAFPARFEAGPGTPGRVELDPIRTRLALTSALTNAAAAADGPLRIVLSGDADRWQVSIVVDRAPPSSVRGFEAQPDRFERIIASSSERTGIDLAIAAWLAGESGGSVRLDVEPGRRSTIVLDWPVKSA
ncbi:MAG TPA: HAMP domain-containing sensor histidine kinase [Isosphaeraceae bacterium]